MRSYERVTEAPALTLDAALALARTDYGPGCDTILNRLADPAPAILRGEAGDAADQINATTLRGHILWSVLGPDAARPVVGSGLQIASGAGVTDSAPSALLVDLAVLEGLAGRRALAEDYLRRALQCGVPLCPDGVFRRLSRIDPQQSRAAGDQAVDAFLRRDLTADWDRL